MTLTISPSNLAILLFTLVALAAIPGVSVMTVMSRTAVAGFRHGLWVTLGIVAADLLFILLAIFALAGFNHWLAYRFADALLWLKYPAAAYLFWLAYRLWRSPIQSLPVNHHGAGSSFMMGFLLTLADQKALLFYLGFLPLVLDIAAITLIDTLVICGMSLCAVSAAKLSYACMAVRAGRHFKLNAINPFIAIALLVTALWLLLGY